MTCHLLFLLCLNFCDHWSPFISCSNFVLCIIANSPEFVIRVLGTDNFPFHEDVRQIDLIHQARGVWKSEDLVTFDINLPMED